MKKDEYIETIDIDFDLFSVDEVVKILKFYKIMEDYKKRKVKKEDLLKYYLEYKNIINNLSLEKKYNDAFYKKTNISIYNEIKEIKKAIRL